jgi:tetratricopeptide (TPR) repeat protein
MQKFLFKRRGLLAGLACLLFVGVFALGIKHVVEYTLPFYFGDPLVASQADSGEKAVALYDAALAHYRAKDYDGAIQLSTQAYSALTAEKGAIAETPRAQMQAAEIQFLLGLSYDRNKKQQQAIDAYEQALRHNPSHLDAKYNLERLLKPSGGGGGGGAGGDGQGQGQGQNGNQPGQQPGGGASHQGKKGI